MPSENSDQPGLGIRQIRSVLIVRMKKADAQADPSLRWAHMSFCRFYHTPAHIASIVLCLTSLMRNARQLSLCYKRARISLHNRGLLLPVKPLGAVVNIYGRTKNVDQYVLMRRVGGGGWGVGGSGISRFAYGMFRNCASIK